MLEVQSSFFSLNINTRIVTFGYLNSKPRLLSIKEEVVELSFKVKFVNNRRNVFSFPILDLIHYSITIYLHVIARFCGCFFFLLFVGCHEVFVSNLREFYPYMSSFLNHFSSKLSKVPWFLWYNVQIFISRDGGNKKYSSVLAPGHHEGLR